MADSSRRPDSEGDIGNGGAAEPDSGSDTGVPRWVKVSGVVIALILLIAVVLLVGGGHGPGMHTP